MVMEEKTSCNGTHQGDLWEDKRSLRVRGREKIWSRQEEKQKNIRGKKHKSVPSSVEFVKAGGCIVGNRPREARNGQSQVSGGTGV